jgi:hypothetical protein
VDFVAAVDQVIALLRQRGRLTYRTLQVQFQLDDAHLARPTSAVTARRSSPSTAGRAWRNTG